MKITLSMAILFLTALLTSCSEEISDEEKIEALCKEYYTSLYGKNIPDMVNCINSKTVNYYEEIVRKAKYSDSVQVTASAGIDKTLILYLRQIMAPVELKKYTGKEFMFFTLKKGATTETPLPKMEILHIQVNDLKAEAGLSMDGEYFGNILFFVKEDNNWKIDFSSTYKNNLNKIYNEESLYSGLSENELVEQMVASLSGEPIKDSLWNKTIE